MGFISNAHVMVLVVFIAQVVVVVHNGQGFGFVALWWVSSLRLQCFLSLSFFELWEVMHTGLGCGR